MPSRCYFPPWVLPRLSPCSKPSTTTIQFALCMPTSSNLPPWGSSLRSSVPHHIPHVNPAQHHPDLDSSDRPRQRRSAPLWPPSRLRPTQHAHGCFPPSLRDCNLVRFSPTPSLYTNSFVHPRASPIQVTAPLFIK